ncbi:DKNYY domain-containing protein [Prevotella sp. P6B4]|uniref:DKNYY domain-containing protein n=1 Tax=Prevotella sp. P6B4 TaxID=1410614 RepID=UPI001E5F7A8E|nr:DKNYY domain-containing protein [Prevotella sp. P6B4]
MRKLNNAGLSLKSLMVIGLIGWSVSIQAQTYDVSHGQVYFGHEPLKYADAHSFVDLGRGYAKDRDNVYLNGRILEYVDPATFRLKDHATTHFRETRDMYDHGQGRHGYYKSQFNVYYGDKKIDASASSFQEVGGGYAKDAFNVFYHGKKLDASATSFKLMEGGYAKDAFNVYYFGKKVKGASAATFKYTGDGYAKDAFNDYYKGRKLE